MAENGRNVTEASATQDCASEDFQKCLQMLEAAGPLRIPPLVRDEYQDEALKKAYGWVLNRNEYQTWITSDRSQLLRLIMPPGSGTGTLSQFLLEEVKQRICQSPDTSLVCIFGDTENRVGDTPAAVLRSLICQMLLQRKALYQHMRADFEADAERQHFQDHLNDFSGLWRNFRGMLQDEHAGQTFIVVDGLQLCRGPTRLDLLRSVRELFQGVYHGCRANVKLLVTYTSNSVDIDDQLSHIGLVLDVDGVVADVNPDDRRPKGSASLAWLWPGDDDDLPGGPVDTTDESRYTAVVELLLTRNAGVSSKDNRFGQSPLSLAAGNGREPMVKLLLDRGVDVQCRDKYGRTPLSLAAGNGHQSVVELLINWGAYVNTQDENNITPLLRAVGNGHETVVRFLLDKRASVHCKSNTGQTPVYCAAEIGHLAITKVLLSHGAAVDWAENSHHRTPLSRAAENGHVAICKLLCEAGVQIDSTDCHHQTPLLWAVRCGHVDVVNLLLRHQAHPDVQDSWYNQTPLIWACRSGHRTLAGLLLDNGAKIDSSDKRLRTALSWAASNGELTTVGLLLSRGADVNRGDQDGRTPLSWAAGNGHADIVPLLLDSNAESRSTDRYGRTPRCWASENAYGAIAKMLR